VLEMVLEVVLEKEHFEEYYQKCLEEDSRNQGQREEGIKRLRQELQELEQRIENATEVFDAKSQFKGPIHSQNSIRRGQD